MGQIGMSWSGDARCTWRGSSTVHAPRAAFRAALTTTVCTQSQDSQSSRPYNPALAPRPRRRGDRMKRREFIAVLAAVIPGARLLLPAYAQTSGIRRIGVIYQGGPYEVSIEGLRDGLKAAGLEEGRHVALLL